jgi:uncharacterized membrane protein
MKPYILTGLAWGAAMVAVSCGIVIYASGLLPESNQIPLHFGADGMPDRFDNKSDALIVLWLLPCVTAVVSAIMAIAPFLDPRKQNLAVGRKAYVVTWICVTTLMTLVTAGVAFGMVKGAGQPFNTSGMVRWIIAGVAVLFIVMGNYLPKARSSFIFGVRTSWTLSSDIAWEKTLRLAGPLFMIAGVLGLIGAFVFSGLFLALQLTALILSVVLILFVYSYFAWRSADDRDDGTSLTV